MRCWLSLVGKTVIEGLIVPQGWCQPCHQKPITILVRACVRDVALRCVGEMLGHVGRPCDPPRHWNPRPTPQFMCGFCCLSPSALGKVAAVLRPVVLKVYSFLLLCWKYSLVGKTVMSLED